MIAGLRLFELAGADPARRFGMTLEAVVADREHTREAFRKVPDRLRDMLKVQSFVGGTSPNYTDYTVFGAFAWARGVSPFPLLLPEDPVHSWREHMLGLFGGYAAASTGFPV